VIRRPCLECGRPTTGSRCPEHQRAVEASRPEEREAYRTALYRANRRARFRYAEGRCEHVEDGQRCWAKAVEIHHVIPLVVARNSREAKLLNTFDNLRAVCRRHNPRGVRRIPPE